MGSATITEQRNNTMQSTEDALQETCRLLSLPRELRDTIYKFAFSSSDEPVDITKAYVPGTALLSVCRQLRKEAISFFPAARREYWGSTHFLVYMANLSVENEMERLNEEDISMITKLEIRDPVPTWAFDNDIWTCIPCEGRYAGYDWNTACPRQAVVISSQDISRLQTSKVYSSSQAERRVLAFFYKQEGLERLVMVNCESQDKLDPATVKATGLVKLSKGRLIKITKAYRTGIYGWRNH